MSRDNKFDDPNIVFNGMVSGTLREAGAYVTKLPAQEAQHEQ